MPASDPDRRRRAQEKYRRSGKHNIAQRQWRAANPKLAWAVATQHRTKKRAAKQELPFNLTTKYILSLCTDVCPVFGVELNYSGNGTICPNSPSVDRLVPEKGYVIGNIAVISHRANVIKNSADSSEVQKVLEWMKKKGV